MSRCTRWFTSNCPVDLLIPGLDQCAIVKEFVEQGIGSTPICVRARIPVTGHRTSTTTNHSPSRQSNSRRTLLSRLPRELHPLAFLVERLHPPPILQPGQSLRMCGALACITPLRVVLSRRWRQRFTDDLFDLSKRQPDLVGRCQGRNQMSEKRRNEMSAFRRSKSPIFTD